MLTTKGVRKNRKELKKLRKSKRKKKGRSTDEKMGGEKRGFLFRRNEKMVSEISKMRDSFAFLKGF